MRATIRQLFLYGLVGMANTATAYAVFALLLYCRVHYALATFIGGVAGLTLGFRLTGRVVFRQRQGSFLRYLMVFAVAYALNVAIQYKLSGRINGYAAGAVATAACFLLSFLLNRAFSFAAEEPRKPESYDADYAGVQIQRSRNPLRRLVRLFYLKDILRHVPGPALDFGCGAGDLLALLPAGSKGLEINASAVEYCRARGLDAELYDPEADGYRLLEVEEGRFAAVLLTHVLEHLERPDLALESLFQACDRLGIQRVILTVPCAKGFKFDPTHRTFVDREYLEEHGLWEGPLFRPSYWGFFPLDVAWVGRYYTFHELRVVFDRAQDHV